MAKFSKSIAHEYHTASSHERHPLYDRATSGVARPGVMHGDLIIPHHIETKKQCCTPHVDINTYSSVECFSFCIDRFSSSAIQPSSASCHVLVHDVGVFGITSLGNFPAYPGVPLIPTLQCFAQPGACLLLLEHKGLPTQDSDFELQRRWICPEATGSEGQ